MEFYQPSTDAARAAGLDLPPEDPTDIGSYRYVDTATGGARHRNQVMRLDDYQPPETAVDCYTTALRFTEELAQYTATHLSQKSGRPSVSGYSGPAWAPYYFADFD